MAKKERIQEQLADLQRGLDSMTIDAFDFAKVYCGDTYSIKDSWFRKIFRERLIWCRRYKFKSKNGVRYDLITPDDMFNQLKRGL